MRILDRQRYWSFLKAYLICFTALVGLYVVIDAFSNIDEFAQVAKGLAVFAKMGRFYLVHMSEFYDRLCGVITMMAAIFTVTWVQRDNELLAMLAAGIGTKRVIRPVLISAALVNLIAVANQEYIMPPLAEELQLRPADTPTKTMAVTGREDLRKIKIGGKEAYRDSRTVLRFTADFPIELLGALVSVEAAQGRYIPSEDPDAPQKGGWLLRGVAIKGDNAVKIPPTILFKVSPEELRRFPPPIGNAAELARTSRGDAYFLRSNITFLTVTRNRSQWYRFATTPELIAATQDPACGPEWTDITIFLHARLLRPLLSLALLFVSLPLVLGGDGRNMFINLGLSLGTSAAFYASLFLFQYLASNNEITPELAAWAPLTAFATVAIARWDTIRT